MSRRARIAVGLVGGATSGFFAWATLIFALYVAGGNVILGRECDVEEDWERRCNAIGRFADENEPLVLAMFAAVAVAAVVAVTCIVVVWRTDRGS